MKAFEICSCSFFLGGPPSWSFSEGMICQICTWFVAYAIVTGGKTARQIYTWPLAALDLVDPLCEMFVAEEVSPLLIRKPTMFSQPYNHLNHL